MVDALSALIRQNADETTRLKREVQRDLLVKKNDVGDKSVLRLVTDIHIFSKTHDFKNNKAKLQTGLFEVKTQLHS